MYNQTHDPDIYLRHHKEIKYVDTLGELYETTETVSTLSYILPEDEIIFHSMVGLDRILEEMIHLCLPSPHEIMYGMRVVHNNSKWKRCLFDLLKKKVPRKEIKRGKWD